MLIFILIFLSSIFSEGIFDEGYLWPTNASNTITAVFGEERPRRFHAGIDVRTYGIIGKEIYAIESGYVSRIKVSSSSYGKTIYLSLIDGNTAVYAHLDKFHSSIEEKSNYIQNKTSSSFVDSYIDKNELKFNKGDIIGYSGDTGGISGPHLHFEIRDKEGKPLNPLKSHFSIEDTLKPIAQSIAFIPFDNSCWINGIQDYVVFDLDKTNEYKYVLLDTISIIGNFGIAIEAIDKINNQEFNFGIYEIELLIDNKLIYKLNFDQYNFEQDYLVYKELDYYLINKYSKKYHRLFKNDGVNLDFVDNRSIQGINLNQDYHNLIINISDINNNKIQVQGVLKGDLIVNNQLEFDRINSNIFSETGFDELILNYSTRYNNSKSFPISYQKIDSQNVVLHIPEEPYEILEYYRKNNSGLKSKTNYIDLIKYDPLKIHGEIDIKHLEKGVVIEFTENIFSGYNANAIIKYNNKEQFKIDLYRKEKNVLSSKILMPKEFKDIKEIDIKYKSYPEKVFKKSINGDYIDSKSYAIIEFDNFIITSSTESLYEDIFLSIEDANIIIDKKYDIISTPIKISPTSIPFRNDVELLYENLKIDTNHCAIYSYNEKKNKWNFMKKLNYNNYINKHKIRTKIYSGGTFAVLRELIKPTISNISPASTATYKSEDLKQIAFNVVDKQSGINSNSIRVKIDERNIFCEYIPYRDFVRCNIEPLTKDYHNFEISIEDKVQNLTSIKGQFKIE